MSEADNDNEDRANTPNISMPLNSKDTLTLDELQVPIKDTSSPVETQVELKEEPIDDEAAQDTMLVDNSGPVQGHVQGQKSNLREKQAEKRAERILQRLNHVWFPEYVWVKRWDALVLFLLFFLAWVIPYQVGVSGGYYLVQNKGWLAFNVLINTVFLFDTFFYFWRAYYGENGHLVINLRRIRIHYLKTLFVPNLISSLPTTLTFYFLAKNFMLMEESSPVATSQGARSGIILIKVLDLTKFIRFVRIKSVFETSAIIRDIRQRYPSSTLQLLKFSFGIALTAHWFACTWCLVAYLEAGSFGILLYETPNWISLWYNTTAGSSMVMPPVGINPFGYSQDLDRYVLSLFWSIQTLTSIGYGNILPYTRAEWWVSTVFMLLAGIMWACVVGGIVGVTASMMAKTEAYSRKIDEANAMIESFQTANIENLPLSYRRKSNLELRSNDKHMANKLKKESRPKNRSPKEGQSKLKKSKTPKQFLRALQKGYTKNGKNSDSEDEIGSSAKLTARRIMLFLHQQYMSEKRDMCATNVHSVFPVYDSLPPQLQREASLHMLRPYLDCVPYLRNELLGTKVQSILAQGCCFKEFSAGESFSLCSSDSNGERGIAIIRSGIALHFPAKTTCSCCNSPAQDDGILHMFTAKKHGNADRIAYPYVACGDWNVLLEDDNQTFSFSSSVETIRALTFVRILWVPRPAILRALKAQRVAWKESARWAYLAANLRGLARCRSSLFGVTCRTSLGLKSKVSG